MSELDLRGNDWANGYPHDPQTLWGELYYLAVIFAGSESISRFQEAALENSLFWVFRNKEYSEISRRLISVAAICRNLMETTRDESLMNRKVSVGRFYPDREKSKNKDLVFREACNKIIHSDHINFDLTDVNTVYAGYLNPKVYLYGNLGEQYWKAEVDVYEFVKEAYNFC